MIRQTGFLASLMLIVLLAHPASAQEKIDSAAVYKHGLGVAAGFTTGYGLSYRNWSDHFGLQFTFAPYMDDRETTLSFGGTFLYNFIQAGDVNFFAYQGNHLRYRNFKYPNSSPNDEGLIYNTGVGMGLEFPLFIKRLRFNVMVGYGAYNNFTELNITGEGGVFFRF